MKYHWFIFLLFITECTYAQATFYASGVTAVGIVPVCDFDLASAVFTDDEAIITNTPVVGDIAFSKGGLKMYLPDATNGEIDEYDLSTAYDVSTATYLQNIDISNYHPNPAALDIKEDGSKLFVTSPPSYVDQYNFGTPFDITSLSSSTYTTISSKENKPTGIALSADGTTMFVTGKTNNNVHEYHLNTAWSLSPSPTYIQFYDISANAAQPEGMAWEEDGTSFLIADGDNDNIVEYTVTTPWTLTGAAYSQEVDISGKDTSPRGVAIRDGTIDNDLYFVGIDNDKVYEYAVGCIEETLFLDDYGTSVEAAYSLRKLYKDYTGACIDIVRISDNTRSDIYFIGEDLDEAAIEAFCSGTTCEVAQWYEQSGTGSVARSPLVNRPTIYADGAILTENNKPAIHWTDDDQYFQVSGGGTTEFNFMHGTGESSVAWVGRAGESANPNAFHGIYGSGCGGTACIGAWFGLADIAPNNEQAHISATRGVRGQPTYNVIEDNTFTPNVQVIYFFHTDNDNAIAADRVEGFEDNVDQTLDNTWSNTGTASNATNTMKIGALGNIQTIHSFRGTMQSLIFWSTDKSSDRTSIYNNQDAYWRP